MKAAAAVTTVSWRIYTGWVYYYYLSNGYCVSKQSGKALAKLVDQTKSDADPVKTDGSTIIISNI